MYYQMTACAAVVAFSSIYAQPHPPEVFVNDRGAQTRVAGPGAPAHIVGLPRTCLTFGLFALVIYLGLLALTAWIAGQIGLGVHIAGFCAAFGGVIIFRASSAS